MIAEIKSEFLHHLEKKIQVNEPKNLYEPINYILSLGGKKIRPLLTIMAANAFGENYKEAFDAALAIEVFHNFTLLHDDIMDDAPLRRGKQTVHEKWDINTGILSGDAMMILAYQCFENYNPETFKKLMTEFSRTALEVCEGQQLDIDFETRNDVTIGEYITMITQKTSVLVAASLKMGAIIANASDEEAEKIYLFGLNLGIAFQLQDDYLDAFGNPESFGKQIGGDIIENKKTYLYLRALSLCNDLEKNKLNSLYNSKLKDNELKISVVLEIFRDSGSIEAIKTAIKDYSDKAFSILESIQIHDSKKIELKEFGMNLMNRDV